MDLSVVIPLYNEEDNVKPLVQASTIRSDREDSI